MVKSRGELIKRIKATLGGLGFRITGKATRMLASEAEQELARAPRIACLGETGVGKSTTLNALFNAGAPIDHIAPCTQESLEYAVVSEIKGQQGVLRIYDMPGIGQDTQSDPRFLKEYAQLLPECEVALWILDAGTRHLSQVEAALRDVVRPAMSGLDRVVIGLNKVDRVEPGRWSQRTNMPSREQEGNIAARVENVKQRLGTALRWTNPRIVAYSAKHHYRLGELIATVVEACPPGRRWVLNDRVALARFEDLIDPTILKQIQALELVVKPGNNKRKSDREPQISNRRIP